MQMNWDEVKLWDSQYWHVNVTRSYYDRYDRDWVELGFDNGWDPKDIDHLTQRLSIQLDMA